MSKKTETIEIRLSPELKADLKAMCSKQGQPVSKLVRRLVEQELSQNQSFDNEKGDGFMALTGRKNWKTLAATTAMALTLAISWNVMTQPAAMAQAQVRASFAMIDQNEDGVITQTEFENEQMMDSFMLLDDERGTHQEDEFLAQLSSECRQSFKKAIKAEGLELDINDFKETDLNKDGKVSYQEYLDAYTKTLREEFELLDQDKNGVLTKVELMQDLENNQQELEALPIAQSCKKEIEQILKAEEAQNAKYDKNATRIAWAILDANRDNQVSFEEFLKNK